MKTCRRKQLGQSMVELLIVVPILLFLVLCIVQMVLLYRAKSTIDFATFEAARAGAISGVNHREMKRAFARGMIPLYATEPGAAGLAAAWARMQRDLLVNHALEMQVISPTPAMWNQFKVRDYRRRNVLPNDSLPFRDNSVGGHGVNIQDANLLKLRVRYRYELKVPFVDLVMGSIIRSSQIIRPTNMLDHELDTGWYNPLTGRFSIPIDAYAIVRMQSPIVDSGNLSGVIR